MRILRKDYAAKVFVLTVIFLLSIGLSSLTADELSGEEILVKVDQKSEVVSQGEILSILTLEDVNADGSTNSMKVGALARQSTDRPDQMLIYFLEPEANRGSIVLSKDTPEGETKMWSYLPALKRKMELSASQKEGSFFGTTLSYKEIGSWSMSETFNAEIVEEVTLDIGDRSVAAYKLQLTEKEGADPQYPRQTIWVGKDNWVLLRSQSFNADGELQKEMEVQELTMFEENTVTEKLVTTVLDSGASTTVIYEKRERPEQDIPDSVFDPEELSNFDPKKWGLSE